MYSKKIFIAGGPRCGTTLMQGLLCKDDNTIPMTKESTYFNFLMEAYQKGKYMWNNHTHCYFRDQLEFSKFSKFLLDNYLKQVYSLYPANVLIHKHPGMTKTFPDVMELYPDSLFIVMLRDPRDAVSSYLKIKRDSGYDVNYFINMFINELEPFMKFFKNNNNLSNVLFVRYEDLLLNTDDQMKKLRNFTGLELNFDPTKEGWKSNRENGEYASELDGKPINGDNIGKSMFELSNKELEHILSFKPQIDEIMPMNIWWDESIYLPHYKSSFRLNEAIKSMYNDGGKQKEIIRLTLDGVKRFGGNEFYYKILGMIYEEIGELDSAEEYLNKSLEIKQDSLVMNSLGLVYEEKGNLYKALEIFYKCVELNGSVADYYNNIGRILIKMGKVEEGKEYSKKAMEMDKEFPEAEYVYEDGILNEVTKKNNKVFCVGINRTGTTTMGQILKLLGYNAKGEVRKQEDWMTDSPKTLEFLLKISQEYNGFYHEPWNHYYKELDERYPDSKFILTIRDEESWWKSFSNYFIKSGNDSWSPFLLGKYGVENIEDNKEFFLEKYREHNKQVMEHFKDTNRLLIVNVFNGDGWSKICPFLNEPIPNVPFPHQNKGIYRS